MLKRVLAVVLAICMMSAFLTACGIKRKDDGAEKDVAAVGKEEEKSTSETRKEQKDDPATEEDSVSKEDLDKALDSLDEAGLDMDDGLRDLLESIDEEDIEAAMQAKANLGDIKITADIPEGWTVEDSDNGSLSAIKDMYTFNVNCMAKQSYMSDDIMEYVQECLNAVKGFFDTAVISELTSVDIDGTKGGRYHIDLEIFGMTQRQMYIYYYKDDMVMMVQGCYMMGMGGDDAAVEAEIVKMMESVKVERK